jgi:hypothetical protein
MYNVILRCVRVNHCCSGKAISVFVAFDEGRNNYSEVSIQIYTAFCMWPAIDGVVKIVIMNEKNGFIEVYFICGPCYMV